MHVGHMLAIGAHAFAQLGAERAREGVVHQVPRLNVVRDVQPAVEHVAALAARPLVVNPAF